MPRDTTRNELVDPSRLAKIRESMGEERTNALLVMFRNELHRRLAAITRASAAGAYRDLAREAQALAGDARAIGLDTLAERALSAERSVIPNPIDQNRCAQSRRPMDMMRQG